MRSIKLIWVFIIVSAFMLAGARFTQAASERYGLNPNDLDRPGRASAVADHFRNLGAKWVRLEVFPPQDPNYWKGVVDEFKLRQINVLVVLSNRLISGFTPEDPNQCATGDRRLPSDNGVQLFNNWIAAATPYVQALRENNRVSDWEIWNEANETGSYLCPENYALFITEARLRWNDIGNMGISLNSHGRGDNAIRYLDDLYSRTDKVLFYRETHKNDTPWNLVMHHPYPGDPPDDNPADFLPVQANGLRGVQPKPLWFTEIGWHGTNEAEQADRLRQAYDVALNQGFADKVFWFALYDCGKTGPFGLIADCDNPNGRQRLSYNRYRELAAGVDCVAGITTCQYPDPMFGGAPQPAVLFRVPQGDQMVHVEVDLWGNRPSCPGPRDQTLTGDFTMNSGLNIVFIQFDPPLSQGTLLSTIWRLGLCPPVPCADYRIGSDPPPCPTGAIGAEPMSLDASRMW